MTNPHFFFFYQPLLIKLPPRKNVFTAQLIRILTNLGCFYRKFSKKPGVMREENLCIPINTEYTYFK